jgi:hypothetical protein
MVGKETGSAIKILLEANATLSATMIKGSDKPEILIYCSRTNADALGDLLLDLDWFLQQPDTFDPSTTYYNPQWLCPPGAEFEQTNSCNAGSTKSSQKLVLGVAQKSKVEELLDSATGPVIFRKAQVSELLVTELKE